MSIWNFQSKWLAHEIEHRVQQLPMASLDEHVVVQDNDLGMTEVVAKNQALPSGIEHQLLHAAEQLHIFVAPFSASVSLSAPGVVFVHFALVTVLHATVEAPFRPPRLSTSFI